MFKHIHETYDPILKTFNELVATPKGKEALREMQEKKREKAIVEYREAEEESKGKAEEEFKKQGEG